MESLLNDIDYNSQKELNNDSMKTIDEMKNKVYDEVLNSGYFRNKQAQIKAHVYDLVEKQYNAGRNKIDFQYEHPLLAKIKKYPLTSLCVDLIQQFLESFKFKHTLNVFKKEINRSVNMNRSHLSQSFKIQIKNPQSQAVLLSLVQQMVSGNIGAVKNDIKINNYTQNAKPAERDNNFMKKPEKSNIETKAQTQTQDKNSSDSNSFNDKSHQDSSQKSSSNINSTSNINATNSFSNQSSNVKEESNQSSSMKVDTSKEESSVVEEPKPKDKGKKGKQEKVKVQKQKPPEEASDLLGDVMKKFQATTKQSKQEEKKSIFESKRAFSEQKQKKVVDPSESGANKIRGVSLGKNVPSFMSKFMNQTPAPQKNESFIDEQLDQFQQSKDSTRKNPLFSSSQSGFDKSGFDHSVDSNAIQEYEYVQRARKFAKKP